jgi:hypothetical protein
VVDRGEPEASCPEWHGDGTAGEDDLGSGLAAMAPARTMGEAHPGRHEPRWHVPKATCRAVTTIVVGAEFVTISGRWPIIIARSARRSGVRL